VLAEQSGQLARAGGSGGSPRAFYLQYGFADTGQVVQGENILALDLTLRG
jgi:hypothetical protein